MSGFDVDEVDTRSRTGTPAKTFTGAKRVDSEQLAKILQGVDIPEIVGSKEAFGNRMSVISGLQLDELFKNEDYPEGGFPFTEMIVFTGLPNTGKTYLAAYIARLAAELSKMKVLWIATEPTGASQAPDIMRNKHLFDVVIPKDLEQLAAFVSTKLPEVAGVKYGAVVIDSISEPCEDSEYMPPSGGDMSKPLKDRATLLRIIKETIRELQADIMDRKTSRKPFMIIMTAHLKSLVRPDAARMEVTVLPEYRNGKLVSGYTLDGSLNNMFQYLTTYTFIHVDSTSKVTVGDEVSEGKHVATLIKVYPQKSRSCGRTEFRTFKISNKGVIR